MGLLRKWFARQERIVIFVGVLALFAAVYFGAAALPPWRTPWILRWDPVWLVPFLPSFIVPYLSAYVMPLIVLAIPADRAAFRRLVRAYVVTILAAGAVFILVPLLPPHPPVIGSGTWSDLVRFQYAIDVQRNLFPSLHVALSFLHAFAVARFLPQWRSPVLLWAVLIAASTLFVRQHYVIDVVGGFVLALVSWRFAFPGNRKT